MSMYSREKDIRNVQLLQQAGTVAIVVVIMVICLAISLGGDRRCESGDVYDTINGTPTCIHIVKEFYEPQR